MARFSANLGFLWPDRPLPARIDAAAAAGFRAIELHWPYDTPAAETRARCEGHGLELLGLNTATGEISAGEFGLGALPGREADFQASVDQAVAYAVETGARAIHCMAGRPAPAAAEAARATLVANLRAASDKARPHGLTLLLEAINAHDQPGYAYSTQAQAIEVIEAVGRHDVRLMFDAYHVFRSEGDVLGVLEQSMPYVGHVQIAGCPHRHEPDTGALDHRMLFEALDRLGYAGWIGCEYKPAGDTDAGLRWTHALGVTLA